MSAPAAGKKQGPKLGFVENFLLSGAAAVISKTVAAPIERVKLLVQNQGEMLKQGKISEPYKGVVDCTVKTFRSEGLYSFWRGNLANCIRYFPTQALNFAFKDQIKAAFKAKKTDPYLVTFGKNIASGGVAGALSLCFVYSLDYARTRLANDTKSAKKGGGERQFNGLIDVYRKTLASDGKSPIRLNRSPIKDSIIDARRCRRSLPRLRDLVRWNYHLPRLLLRLL